MSSRIRVQAIPKPRKSSRAHADRASLALELRLTDNVIKAAKASKYYRRPS